MTSKFRVPELLAPAGNLEKLKIAILYGADAVYVAGQQFSLRAGSENFSRPELEEGVTFAHKHDAKVYATLNAFLHDSELKSLPAYVQFLQECGIDAVIASDLGVIDVVQKHSNLPIHLSTQASCLNRYSAALWKNLGVRRLILGREVSVDQAALIRKEVDIEVELFVHGSMCMAYSGNCTISNYTLARDSNRGGCAQSCRFSYNVWENRDQRERGETPENEMVSFMSSKDLQGMEILPKFVDSKIDSIKIEGRMKSNLYVATTVQAYAKALGVLAEQGSLSTSEISGLTDRLGKIPHRLYTQASLSMPAGADSIYLHSDRMGKHNSNYEIAGTVVEVHPSEFVTLLVQNGFDDQCVLEVLTFEGETLYLSTKNMKDVHRKPIQHAKPNTLITLPFVDKVSQLNLARKPCRTA